MENLKYIIEDTTIAEILGVQNFTNKESAILELVKNSFDASATQVTIIFENDKIIIEDNGVGMDINDINKHWMHIGKSNKGYSNIDKDGNLRILAGSKGIGRFALARLGSKIELYSKKIDKSSILWCTDWSNSTIEETISSIIQGTKLKIFYLRDTWNKKTLLNLSEYLSKTYNSTVMSINIIAKQYNLNETITPYFTEPILGINCASIINLNYNSVCKQLSVYINSDEFQESAKKYCKDININHHKKTITINTVDIKNPTLSKDEINNLLNTLGDFNSEFYFSLNNSSSDDKEKFLYKYTKLSSRYNDNIILYRNSFSISSYDGSKDWLELGKRSRLSPAAATHPTGAWRVRANQLSGKINIDKKDNVKLEDLSNRQGLNENPHFFVFISIINLGISIFEGFRQSIIRKINTKNHLPSTVSENNNKTIVNQVIKSPNLLSKLTEQERSQFISGVEEYKKDSFKSNERIIETEKRYTYDIRILNVLATSGLKATSIAHEIDNNRNNILATCDLIISAMKKCDIWEYVNKDEYTKLPHLNIPYLITSNQKNNYKMISFIDTILKQVEKNQFVSYNQNISNLFKNIISIWQNDYIWVKINLNISEDITCNISSDILHVILDNLILNSIQQNDTTSSLIININVSKMGPILFFEYKDNGVGLNEKYVDNPMKILEVHETTRSDGHGLGMWIVNNTIMMTGGEILRINGSDGFNMEFNIGDKI